MLSAPNLTSRVRAEENLDYTTTHSKFPRDISGENEMIVLQRPLLEALVSYIAFDTHARICVTVYSFDIRLTSYCYILTPGVGEW